MEVRPNYAFVLCAGFGTRMGPVGRELPKPLWPLFETTILGHLLNQLLEMNFSAIYVNAHHQADQVDTYLKKFYPSVHLLRENPILDSGGALVQCAHHIGSRRGQLFSFNGDNIIDLSTLSLSSRRANCTLLSEVVALESDYNRLLVEEGYLKEIIPAHSESRALYELTYAGISIIDLSFTPLWQAIRPLGIFKHLLDFKRDKVKVEPFEGAQIDLGTLAHYHGGLVQLLSHYEKWEPFLKRYCGLKESKLNLQSCSYHAPRAQNSFNFSSESLEENLKDVIILGDERATKMQSSHISWRAQTYPLT